MKKESVAVAIFQGGKILLIQRRDVPVWVLPGGGVEQGETPKEAAIREVLEETGLQIKISKKIGVYLPINRLSSITHLFRGEIVSGKIIANAETKEVDLFFLDELPKLLPPPFGTWVKAADNNKQLVNPEKLLEITYARLLFEAVRHPILVGRFLLARLGLPINR